MRRCCFILLAIIALHLVLAPHACATLKFYYDPLTGNVSFDTSETRSGGLYGYAFDFPGTPPALSVRLANSVRLSSSTLYSATPNAFGEGTLDSPWRGLYTIGDIFPIGLSEQFWTSAFEFSYQYEDHRVPLAYSYADVVGGGAPPAAEFIYGRPTGEFNNKWDIVDPASLKWATTAKLVYNAANGDVVIDTTGDSSGYISSFMLESDGQFLADNFTPFTTGPFQGASPNMVALFANAIEPGQYSIGEILGPGASLSEFQAKFTSARFMGRAGFRGGNFDFATNGVSLTLEYVGVPEPISVELAALALACIISAGARSRRLRPRFA